MSIKKACLFLMYCLYSLVSNAQDVQFTQQYANRLYLNPAFTGLNHDWSVSFAHRNQWPALNGSFVTNQLTADFSIPGQKGAAGLILQQDRAGIGGLRKLHAALSYGYHTTFTKKWAIAAGLQASITSLALSYDNLVFGDQLSDNGMVAVTSAEINSFEPTNYLSVSVGGLAFTDQFWIGLTAAQLNKPSYGFGQNTKLPIQFTANTGYKFYARSYVKQGKLFELSFSPAVTYTRQENFSRTDIGLYTILTPLTLGFVYKGVPVSDLEQDQTLALIAGLQLEQFKVGFSHDVGISGFSRQAGGANEISLIFERLDVNKLFPSRLKYKNIKHIICPAF
ncbi:PorP/SprF family type IX secretion system membrane protein [Pontibacter harenae]|uniref:PorP/SprF family type IX secretion system membrane protein n=1 Tax=Pontibacter harenae TaxID=2894083 RepID=UPI001E60552C|nr:PorP/SprF family type IX secretion system membrane protein [Pontibacter harenae]MCC9165384.1 PorP/SprF family type IX secretion system membrane protein [Pontibacter harenae]